MAPEAVMLLIDSSEYMRNGDFPPTRFEAQQDAVSVLFNAKINANPENTVGVMTMGGFNGKGPEVLATPTADLGKILSAMHKASIGGESDLYTGIQIAQLALKHRQNKTQRQRLIILVGSPLSASQDEKALVKLGKKLKKNNVAVDVVTFASELSEATGSSEGESNEPALIKFVESVNSGDNSHFLAVQPGPRLLSDMIISSEVMGLDGFGGGGSGGMDVEGGGSGGGGGGGFEFGVDPDMDPELAMVLRMSMEEEQARQAAAASSSSSAAPALESVPEASSSSSTSAPAPTPSAASAPQAAVTQDDDDAELAAALAQSVAQPTAAAADGADVEMGAPEGEDEEDEDEEEAMRKAIELSMQEEQQRDGEAK